MSHRTDIRPRLREGRRLPLVLIALVFLFEPRGADALTLGVSTPPSAMTLLHSVPASATAIYTVTSIEPRWTLSILDKATTTPGRMDRVDCLTRTPLGGSLSSALTWAHAAAGTSGTLGSSAQVVKTGALAATVEITYSQGLTSSDSPTAGDCFDVTATLRLVAG